MRLGEFIRERLGIGFFVFILLVATFVGFMAGGLVIPVPRIEVRTVAIPDDMIVKQLASIPQITEWSLFYSDVSQFHFLKIEAWSLYVTTENSGGKTEYKFNNRSLDQLNKDIQFLKYVLK